MSIQMLLCCSLIFTLITWMFDTFNVSSFFLSAVNVLKKLSNIIIFKSSHVSVLRVQLMLC